MSAKARLQHGEALTAGLPSLAPWVDDAAGLAVLVAPDESTVQAWKDRAEEDATVLARRRDDPERLEDEERTQTTALDAVAKVPVMVGTVHDERTIFDVPFYAITADQYPTVLQTY